LQEIIANTGWLFADRILRMGVGLFVGVWIARYLGPDQFGVWSFATSFVALFAAFAGLGLDGIVVRELVKNPASQNELLGTALVLKISGGIGALLVVLVSISVARPGESLTLWLVAISALGLIAQSLNVFDFYFQAKLQSRYTVYASNAAFLIVAAVKILLLLNAAPLVAFAWAGFVEIVLVAIFLVIAYRYTSHTTKTWRFDARLARALLVQSWPLILSGMAVMLYMRIDQVMLGQMMGDKEVGLYSAAIRVSEAWYFIPAAIVSSIFPALIDANSTNQTLYNQRLQKLYNLMVIISLLVAIPMTFFSDFVMTLMFGHKYLGAGMVLSISIWCGLFASLSVASGKWFIVEGHTKLALRRNLYGAVLNIGLNYCLIPIYGITGAAISTLLAFALSAYISDAFSKKTRIVFRQKTRAILLVDAINLLCTRSNGKKESRSEFLK
jgi:polysaccharide transporter, PST family